MILGQENGREPGRGQLRGSHPHRLPPPLQKKSSLSLARQAGCGTAAAMNPRHHINP